MKKKYIAPATMVVNVKTEGIMHAGSIGNAGDKTTQEGKDNYQTGVPENKDSGIEVDAKGFGDWDNVWED